MVTQLGPWVGYLNLALSTSRTKTFYCYIAIKIQILGYNLFHYWRGKKEG